MPDTSDKNQITTLKKRAEFLSVAASGNKIVTTTFIVQYAARPLLTEQESSRVGLTATRKLGGAVVRNRAKRRLRAAIHQVLGAMAPHACDYVFIARGQTVDSAFDLVLRDMRYAVNKIGKHLKGTTP